MPKIPSNIEREQLRLGQMEAAQMLLFTMVELGEKQAMFQTEFEGIERFLVVRTVTQTEFDSIAAQEIADRRAARQRGATGPL